MGSTLHRGRESALARAPSATRRVRRRHRRRLWSALRHPVELRRTLSRCYRGEVRARATITRTHLLRDGHQVEDHSELCGLWFAHRPASLHHRYHLPGAALCVGRSPRSHTERPARRAMPRASAWRIPDRSRCPARRRPAAGPQADRRMVSEDRPEVRCEVGPIADVVTGQHERHARHFARPRRVDTDDAGVRAGAPQQTHVQHAR